jgi:hypothetical protein
MGARVEEVPGLSESSQVAQPLVYVVVLNYRNYADTIRCVRSLEDLHYDNCRIVVMDYGSPNESVRALRAACADHTVVQSGSNLGYAGGNNVGVQLANLKSLDYYLKSCRSVGPSSSALSSTGCRVW